MAYTDDAVLARLSSLNETHDSIATAAQWIMFHRRHADRTVQLWIQRLKDSSATRRLSLIYLANEVAQQSKIRSKDDFINALAPVMAEAISIAYKGSPSEIQIKLKRVIDVWRDRSIFEGPIIGAVDARINELDKARGGAKAGFTGAPFGGGPSVPSEFQPLVKAHQAVSKLSIPLKATIASANQEHEKQTDPTTPQPSAPVYAARLNGLLKTLASAENAVAECVKARETLVAGLEQLLNANRSALDEERAAFDQLSKRKTEVEEKKNAVEMGIMQALGPTESNGLPVEGSSASLAPEPERPEMEALTPEMEAITPPSLPDEPQDFSLETLSSRDYPTEDQKGAASAQSLNVSTNGSNKRRRVDDSDGMPNLEGEDEDLDPEVAQMLKDDDI